MEKLKLHSPDLTQVNIEKIAQLFPNCAVEALDADGTVKRSIDFDQLRQELSGTIVEGPQERYQLNWPGKREALLTANAPIAKTLRPCRAESVDFDTTKNLFIEGDNLDALKLLQETYLSKVKMIYIDPPYNTGNDFIYEDDFAENTDEYLKKSNQVDLDGRRLISNTLANGRFHSDWMSMIYQRLKLSRNLLRDDGLIFISISDEEVCNLGKICDEIFGESNFIAKLIWNTEGHTDNQYDIKVNHEYILVYAKSDKAKLGYVIDPNTRQESNLWKGFAENSITKNGPANPPSEITLPIGFPCLAENLSLDNNYPSQNFFDAVNEAGYITKQATENSGVTYPIRRDSMNVSAFKLTQKCRVFAGWANADKLKIFINGGCEPIDEGDGNTLSFYLSDRGVIYYRRDREKARNIVSVLRNFGTTEQMKSELAKIGIPFDYPKPKQLIAYLIKMGANNNSIVLDFFAGSGTTANAIFDLQDSGELCDLRFILVQLPETLDGKNPKQKPGFDFCKSLARPTNIAEICKERIRRTQRSENGSHIGFRVLKVDNSNMKDVFYTPDAVSQDLLSDQVNNIREDRTPEDLLFQVLLDWGVDLALPVKQESIAGKDVYFVDGNALAACFEEGVSEEFVKLLAKREPLRVVFRDAGFASDSVKINVEQIFKLMSPSTEVKTI